MKKTILTIFLYSIMSLIFLGCDSNSKQFNIKNAEQLKENVYSIISDAYLEENIDISYLFKFNNTVYARSYSVIDYIGCQEFIGTIDTLIDSNYIPRNNGETNNIEMLNAGICEVSSDWSVIKFNNEYVLFKSIN